MQVMGQVAREHEFVGKFLSALCDPALGIEIGWPGARRERLPTLQETLRAASNSGMEVGNSDYAAQVFARMSAYQ